MLQEIASPPLKAKNVSCGGSLVHQSRSFFVADDSDRLFKNHRSINLLWHAERKNSLYVLHRFGLDNNLFLQIMVR